METVDKHAALHLILIYIHLQANSNFIVVFNMFGYGWEAESGV